ncbi:MAG TPA: hypothetical protein VFZ65_18845 [Planctomycetota bacterium]|nr:hypothetical protein [Planctomycetota bacterium]
MAFRLGLPTHLDGLPCIDDDPAMLPVPRAVASVPTLLSILAVAASAAAQLPQLLIDGNPAPGVSSNPTSFGRGAVDGTATLVFDDGMHGDELWQTDGSTAGTVRVTNFTGPAIFRWVTTMADLTLFVVERGTSLELWRTDGSPAGTTLLHAGTVSSGLFYPNAEVAHGSVSYFADNGTTWRTDGTAAGTFSLGVPSATWKAPLPGATLLYGSQGQLIVSDGNTASVVGSAPGALVVTPDWGLFQATLQIGPTGLALAVTARHLAGSPTIVVPFPNRLLPVPGRALLIASATGLSRWDGLAPPHVLQAWTAMAAYSVAWGANWVFAATVPGAGSELVVSDGTPAGTRVVDVVPGPASSNASLAFVLRDRVVFWATTGGLGSEPHATDGTPAGTVRLGDLEPGAGSSSFGGFTRIGERRAVLAVETSALGKEPWLTDGTPAGTTLLADILPGPGSSLITAGGFVTNVGVFAGGELVFIADDGVHGREPWVLPVPGSRDVLQRYSTRRFDVGDPVLGASEGLHATWLLPSDVGIVAVGRPLPACLPIAAHRCVHVDPLQAVVVATVFASPSGDWNGALALPNLPAAVGLDLVAQALFVEPAQPLGFDAGDAHWLSLGF